MNSSNCFVFSADEDVPTSYQREEGDQHNNNTSVIGKYMNFISWFERADCQTVEQKSVSLFMISSKIFLVIFSNSKYLINISGIRKVVTRF